MVKAPKLHFLDSGLVCYLLNIREPEQLRHHPLRGAIRGLEMDVLMNLGDRLCAIEIKSAATVTADFFKRFEPFSERVRNTDLPARIENSVVYGGEVSQQRSAARLIAWRDVGGILRGESVQ